jgi:hypothetical protein
LALRQGSGFAVGGFVMEFQLQTAFYLDSKFNFAHQLNRSLEFDKRWEGNFQTISAVVEFGNLCKREGAAPKTKCINVFCSRII